MNRYQEKPPPRRSKRGITIILHMLPWREVPRHIAAAAHRNRVLETKERR